MVLVNHVPVFVLGDIVIFLLRQRGCFSASLLCFSAAPSISFCQPNLCYFIPTLLLLDYFTVIIRYQFCATSRIQFTIKSKIMLPIIQIFHILLMVQEHVLSSPSYLGDISPFQHLFPILPFTGKSQTHH